MEKRGGNRAAIGRTTAGYCNVRRLLAFLLPFITSAECFNYTTDRSIKATNKEVLLSDKYRKLFEAGRDLWWAPPESLSESSGGPP